jgi:hypothetical protein
MNKPVTPLRIAPSAASMANEILPKVKMAAIMVEKLIVSLPVLILPACYEEFVNLQDWVRNHKMVVTLKNQKSRI